MNTIRIAPLVRQCIQVVARVHIPREISSMDCCPPRPQWHECHPRSQTEPRELGSEVCPGLPVPSWLAYYLAPWMKQLLVRSTRSCTREAYVKIWTVRGLSLGRLQRRRPSADHDISGELPIGSNHPRRQTRAIPTREKVLRGPMVLHELI